MALDGFEILHAHITILYIMQCHIIFIASNGFGPSYSDPKPSALSIMQ